MPERLCALSSAPPYPNPACAGRRAPWGSGQVPLACLLCRLSQLDPGDRAHVLAAMERLADQLSRRPGPVQGPAQDPAQGRTDRKKIRRPI